MSAKRYKVSTYHSRTGVPLPSFGVGIQCPSTTATVAPLSSREQTESLLINLNDDERRSILNFSTAVEMQLRRLASSGGNRRIPLNVCFDLIERTQGLTIPALPENDRIEWKTGKELFLYKFLYVTATAGMFTIQYEEMKKPAATNTKGQASSCWFLRQQTPESGTTRVGLNDVRTVLFDPSPQISPGTDASDLRSAVLSLRPKKPPVQNPQPEQSTHVPKLMDSKTLPLRDLKGSTVEDRVRAKHEARLRREETRASTEASGASQDNTVLLRVADIMWNKSRSVWQRHEKFASPKRKRKSSPCSFILSDIVKLLINQSAPFGGKMTKREVVQFLQALCDRVPDWIHRSTSKAFGEWQPDDTLWIEPLDYQVVRDRLLGKTTASAQFSRATLFGANKEQAMVAPDHSRNETKETAKMKVQILDKKLCPTNALVAAKKRLLWTEKNGQSMPAKSASSSEPTSPPPSKKIRIEDSETTPNLAKPAQPRLRINPKLILSDADYDGGECIKPSRKDSPRGLRNLFRQLNSGKRI